MKNPLFAQLLLAFAAILPVAATAQVPVQPAVDQEQLLASADPALRANKRLVYDFWREVFEAGQVAQADDEVDLQAFELLEVERAGRGRGDREQAVRRQPRHEPRGARRLRRCRPAPAAVLAAGAGRPRPRAARSFRRDPGLTRNDVPADRQRQRGPAGGPAPGRRRVPADRY